MIHRAFRSANTFTDIFLVRRLSAVGAHERVFSKEQLFEARNPELCDERKVPAKGLAQDVFNVECFALLRSSVSAQHSSNFYEMCERRRCSTFRIAIAVNEANHVVEIVEMDLNGHRKLEWGSCGWSETGQAGGVGQLARERDRGQ